MNDNQKTTRNHDESRATTNTEEGQAHNSKEQLAAGRGAEKTIVQTAAMQKKLKRNNRPRPLL